MKALWDRADKVDCMLAGFFLGMIVSGVIIVFVSSFPNN